MLLFFSAGPGIVFPSRSFDAVDQKKGEAVDGMSFKDTRMRLIASCCYLWPENGEENRRKEQKWQCDLDRPRGNVAGLERLWIVKLNVPVSRIERRTGSQRSKKGRVDEGKSQAPSKNSRGYLVGRNEYELARLEVNGREENAQTGRKLG